jgi:uncharacterized protein (TIGR02246 family)
MKRETSLGACALAVLVSGCQTMPGVDPIVEAQAIKTLDAQWVEAIASKDVAKIAAFYADDAVLLPPNEEAKTGEAIKQAWADTVGMPNVHLAFAPTRVEIDKDGSMAIDVGTYTFSFDSPKGKVEDHGKYAQVWEKKDGGWKCAVDMYNSSVPLPAPMEIAAPPPAPPAPPAAPVAPKKKKK